MFTSEETVFFSSFFYFLFLKLKKAQKKIVKLE